MRPWTEALYGWLADYYALTTVVLVAGVAAIGWLKQPARRLLVGRSCVVGLVMLAILPALPGWPRVRLSVRPADTQPARPPVVADLIPDSGTATPFPLAARINARRATPAGQTPPSRRHETGHENGATGKPAAGATAAAELAVDPTPDWRALAGRAFLAGGTLMLAWLGIGYWQTTVIRRRSRPAPQWSRGTLARIVGDGQAAPDLLVSDGLGQPVAVGLLRPTIILADRFVEDEPRSRLEAALAHEWAHIRNRDLWWIALTRILMPILFAHPGYWWLRRRVRDDQELLADAVAAAGRADYAEALISWARRMPDRPGLAVAGSLALWERPSQLKNRIVTLLDRDFHVEPTCPKRWGKGVRGGMVLAVLALSVLTFRPTAIGADPAGLPVAPTGGQIPDPKASNGTESGAASRVLDPDGKPAAGAAVYFSDQTYHPSFMDHDPRTAVLLTRTGSDGSFRLSPDDMKAVLDHGAKTVLDRKAQLVVMAQGCGPAFLDPSGDGMKVLRLTKDDVPIRGRVIDIQGRPVAEATVQLVGILWPASGELDQWLDALKTDKVAYPITYRMLRNWASDDIPSLFPAVRTDREGRFTLKGVGRERIAALLVSGRGIETRFEFVATRSMPALKVADWQGMNPSFDVIFHGAAVDLVAAPGLEIAGTIRDKDTGKPLAGVTVQTTSTIGNPPRFLKTTTDARGQYRLSGVPSMSHSGEQQELLAAVKEGPPYVPSVQGVGDARDPGPIRKDFVLKRGAWARGRVFDKSTGKPVLANLDYFFFDDNPHLKDYPVYGTVSIAMPYHADENGDYKIAVMPGRGILGALAGNDTYRLGVGLDKIKGLKESLPGMVPASPSPLYPGNLHRLVEINPKPGDESVKADFELDPGRTVKGKLVGPDGEPVAGAWMMGALDRMQTWSERPLPSAVFEVHALGSTDKRGLLFYHEAKRLAGAYIVKPDEEGPVTIRLEPCGTLTGRLVDVGGEPQAGARMTCDRPYDGGDSRFEIGSLPSPIKTETDGRFRISGLVPGLKYSIVASKGRMSLGEAIKNAVTTAGEVKDLGDIKVGE
jgi:hypothetical protein